MTSKKLNIFVTALLSFLSLFAKSQGPNFEILATSMSDGPDSLYIIKCNPKGISSRRLLAAGYLGGSGFINGRLPWFERYTGKGNRTHYAGDGKPSQLGVVNSKTYPTFTALTPQDYIVLDSVDVDDQIWHDRHLMIYKKDSRSKVAALTFTHKTQTAMVKSFNGEAFPHWMVLEDGLTLSGGRENVYLRCLADGEFRGNIDSVLNQPSIKTGRFEALYGYCFSEPSEVFYLKIAADSKVNHYRFYAYNLVSGQRRLVKSFSSPYFYCHWKLSHGRIYFFSETAIYTYEGDFQPVFRAQGFKIIDLRTSGGR